MRNIKLIIALMAVVFSLAAVFAFTGKSEKTLTPVWYVYDNSGDLDNPASYTKDGGNIPEECDNGVDRLCAILLPDNGSNPSQTDLDQTFVAHIEEVMFSEDPDDPTVRLKE